MHTNSQPCSSDYPFNAGTLYFAHGQTFQKITLSSSSGIVPCVNPANGANCANPGKSGFIYAGDPYNELITAAEFSTQETYVCDNGNIHAGSTVSAPPPPPPADPTATPRPPDPTATPNPACADGRDNDGDGLVDLNDPGCSSPSDSDESDGTSQCQDGRDNDGDGLTDLNDTGCSAPTDNDESNEPTRITLSAECVLAHSDGSKTAYFSYNNSSGGALSVPTGLSSSTQNQFLPSGTQNVALTSFKSGSVLGAVGVKFSGSTVEWRVRPQGGALATATANANTPPCKNITPQGVCKGFLADGTLRVRYGYSNPNDFEIAVPVGPSNQFSPGAADRGQPTVFFRGLVASSVEVKLSSPAETLSWNLTGVSASTASLPTCAGECDQLPVGGIKTELNQIAIELANLTKTAAAALKAAAVADAKAAQQKAGLSKRKREAGAKSAEDDFVDADRAAVRADEQVALANKLLLEIPSISVTCPNAPQTCKKIDRIQTLDGLRSLYAEAVDLIKRINARTNFRKFGKTVRNDPIVVKAKQLDQQGTTELQKLPRFAEECSK